MKEVIYIVIFEQQILKYILYITITIYILYIFIYHILLYTRITIYYYIREAGIRVDSCNT